MNCNKFDRIVKREKEYMKYPMDLNSLYANRIYDNQTAYNRAYALQPIDIVEGFGSTYDLINTIIKWLIILLIIYIFVIFLAKYIK